MILRIMGVFLLLSSVAYPQDNRRMSGRVTDENGMPIEGVVVASVSDTKLVDKTDQSGYFSLKAGQFPDTLKFSHLAYNSTLLPVKSIDQIIDVRLIRQDNAIEEVVVNTGYYTVPKERATGSFTFISNEELNRSVGSNVLERLEGIASSVHFDRRSAAGGDPEGAPTLRVRGVSTLEADANPLIIVDNFPYEGNIEQINPNDVESITILRDAAAASIWGAKAGNGVIVITSKKGSKHGRLRASINSNITVLNRPDLFYSQEYLPASTVMAIQEKRWNSNLYRERDQDYLPPYVELLIKRRDNGISEEEFLYQKNRLEQNDLRKDISDRMYRPEIRQQHHLNIGGGGTSGWFNFSAGQDTKLGTKIGDQDDRISLNTQSGFSIGSKAELSAQLVYTKIRTTSNSTSSYASGEIYESLLDESGKPNAIGGAYRSTYREKALEMGLLDWMRRPLDEPYLVDQVRRQAELRFVSSLKYNLVEGLNLSLTYQYINGADKENIFYDKDSYHVRNLVNRYTQSDGTKPIPEGGIREYGSPMDITSNSFRFQGDFSRDFYNLGRIDFIGGGEIRENKNELGTNITLYGFDEESWKMAVITDYQTRYPLRPTGTGRISNTQSWPNLTTGRYLSYFANLGYSLKEKYLLSGSLRWDGSNLLGVKTNQRGTLLYSVGAAYNLHRESGLADIFNQLKARLSYGAAGNIDKSQSHYPTIALASNAITGLPEAMVSHPGNPDLKWEQVNTVNFGVDFSLKKKRLNGFIELYHKKSTDLLGAVLMDPTTGIHRTTNYKSNYANMNTKGIDVQLSYELPVRSLGWKTTVLLSQTENAVKKYKAPTVVSAGYYINGTLPREGQSIDMIYAFPWYGLSKTTGLPVAYHDGQEIIDPNDFTQFYRDFPIEDARAMGSAVPTIFGSWMNTFSYKNITLSILLSYKGNYYFRRNSIASGEEFLDLPKFHMDYFKRWKFPGDELHTDVPAYTETVLNNEQNLYYKHAEVLVEKGDHIRLQDINLSYMMPGSFINRWGIKNLRLFIYARNLGILWKATERDIDPDYTNFQYPAVFRLAGGVQLNF